MAGPLAGIRVVELQGRGPGPFGAMVLSDLGADVLRVARPEDAQAGPESGMETQALLDWGFSEPEVHALLASRAVLQGGS